MKDTLTQLKERDLLPAIWFIFSRKGCDLAVSYVEVEKCLLTYVDFRKSSILAWPYLKA